MEAIFTHKLDHQDWLTKPHLPYMIAGGPVSWSSRKQPITALSTTEAEYVAATEAAKQALPIRVESLLCLGSVPDLGIRGSALTFPEESPLRTVASLCM